MFFGELLQTVGEHLREITGLAGSHELTRERFRTELAEMDLLGRRFTVAEYEKALEERLGIDITIEEVPDGGRKIWGSEIAGAGNLAEVAYCPRRREAVVLVRQSLRRAPWPAYELAVYHELSHLAAGHPGKLSRHARARRRGPRSVSAKAAWPRRYASEAHGKESEDEIEREADRRAEWLLIAGMLPEVFAVEDADRVA